MKSNHIYILGGFQTDFARNWCKENKHISAIMREAYEGSCDIVEARDIQAAFIGNFASELYSTQAHLGAFFIDFDPHFLGLPTLRTEAACASSGVAILTAMSYILAGIYDLVCIIGVEQMKTVNSTKGGEFLGTAAWYEKEAKGVEFPFPKLFGQLGEIYDTRYGLDQKYLARISTINYANAKRNPNAQTRNWFMNFEHASTVSEYNPLIGGMIKLISCL